MLIGDRKALDAALDAFAGSADEIIFSDHPARLRVAACVSRRRCRTHAVIVISTPALPVYQHTRYGVIRVYPCS